MKILTRLGGISLHNPPRICAAIRDDGLKTPAEIGKTLKAGTNCGSCIPEIKKMIASQLLSPVA